MLAAGLARRHSPLFGWANCSGSTADWDRAVLEALESGSPGRRVDPVTAEELRPNPIGPRSLDAVVDPQGLTRECREQLVDFLRLPEFFQRLLARSPSGTLLPAVVLTNVDALPYSILRDGLGDPRLHNELRVEGVCLVVTFRGNPPPDLEDAFDHLFRVDPPSGAVWLDSFVHPERGDLGEALRQAGPLRDWWQRLGLDPRMLS